MASNKTQKNKKTNKKKYKKLPFEQYFIDQSLGNYGGTPRFQVPYKKVEYKCRHNHPHDAYYAVIYDEEREVIQIYLKETSSKSQWAANFNFPDSYFDRFQYKGKDIQLKAARGWSDLYSALKTNIRQEYTALAELYPNKEVEIIGWSLGSAIAQLCAEDLYYQTNFKVKAHVFTFGSVKPFCGKNKDMKAYLADCCKECYNFRDINDIVGYLVPLYGYFAMKHINVRQDKFSIFKLFKPGKYHTEYYKEELYQDFE
jgi:hypothetical protein